MKEISVSGREALILSSELLQRARLINDYAGIWEAADVQWWWRTPRLSDTLDKLFWLDEVGPVAGVLVTSWRDDLWQCDPVIVPGTSAINRADLWQRAMEHMESLHPPDFEVPISDDDHLFQHLATRDGMVAGDSDRTAWLQPVAYPSSVHIPDGYSIVDRSKRRNSPHPMRYRNGEAVAERLLECSLYNPVLDLAIETAAGDIAGYSLYWFDPVTHVGLVEPVRVEDAYQRRGLARAMLITGVTRLFGMGASGVKASYETEAAGNLYQSVGFKPVSSATWYRSPGSSRPGEPPLA